MDIKQFKDNAALSRVYLDNEGYYINFEEAKVTVPGPFAFFYPFESMIRESVGIIARRHNACNDNLSYNIPKTWLNIIKKS